MNGTFDANLRNIIIVKHGISHARAGEKKEARHNEEKCAQIKSLGGFRDCSMNWYKGCVLDKQGFRIDSDALNLNATKEKIYHLPIKPCLSTLDSWPAPPWHQIFTRGVKEIARRAHHFDLEVGIYIGT